MICDRRAALRSPVAEPEGKKRSRVGAPDQQGRRRRMRVKEPLNSRLSRQRQLRCQMRRPVASHRPVAGCTCQTDCAQLYRVRSSLAAHLFCSCLFCSLRAGTQDHSALACLPLSLCLSVSVCLTPDRVASPSQAAICFVAPGRAPHVSETPSQADRLQYLRYRRWSPCLSPNRTDSRRCC